MMNEKIPLIKICGSRLVDNMIQELDPAAAAADAFSKGFDKIFVLDTSKDDEGAEEAILALRDICNTTKGQVYGQVRSHRFEDIKKILYSGCAKAVISVDEGLDEELADEISKRFGKDRLAAASESEEMLINLKYELSDYYSEIILLEGESADELIASADLYTAPEPEAGKAQTASSVVWEDLKINEDGLVPCIVQDVHNGEVLMMAWMNKEAYEKTIDTGTMTYFSRSRNTLWVKGETSGHYQYMKSLSVDCDCDTLLAKVEQVGAACHTGNRSCFYTDIVKDENTHHDKSRIFDEVYAIIEDRKANPKEGSYTNYLFDKGIDKILKKLGEEATEIVIAAKNPDPEEIKYEIADFLYHAMVLMVERGVTWDEIRKELARR